MVVVRFDHRAAPLRASHWSRCAGQRSLPGAGVCAQLLQIGVSQVPERRDLTFQSQSLPAGFPHAHLRRLRRGPQAIARPPPGSWTVSQVMQAPRARRPPARRRAESSRQ
jgi:hypothetical protein